MNFESTDWLALLITWFPMLLIAGVWFYYRRNMTKDGGIYGQHKRMADALERIAAALEKRQL